jgi:hypothetical protein
MAGTNIFQDGTRTVPTSDPMISRVDMEQQDIGGRKSHLATINKGDNYQKNEVSITHVGQGGNR